MSVRIMTDSAADFSLEELKEKNVELIPMPLSCGEKTIIDDKTTAMETFWELMISGTDIKTSQPSPDTFIKHFEAARAAGDQVLCILISSALSGTYQGANLAKSMLDDNGIYLIDSMVAAAPEKLLVYKACRLREQGLSAAGIASELELYKDRLRLYACIDTLEYLVRGGRLNRTAGAVGNALKLKPLVTISSEGTVTVEKKAMGIKRAMKELTQLIMSRPVDIREKIIPIYAYDAANCREFLAGLKEAGFTGQLEEPQQIGATIGAYIGPGGYGLAFVEEAEEQK